MTASAPSPTNPAPDAEQLIIRLPGQASDWKEVGLWAGVLALLALVTFFPATSGTALLRDSNWVRFAPVPGALSAVWSDKAPMPAYEPMAFTAYWLEYRLQGKSTTGEPVVLGFHLGAIILHAAAVVLFWLILRDLRVPGAWLAAAIFAVHPVNTEAVSWISSQDVVLAGALGFGAVYCWMHFARFRDRDIAERAEGGVGVDPAITWSLYGGGFLLAVLSVLSNPVGVIFPAMAMFALGWRRRLTSSDVLVLVIPGVICLILWAIQATMSPLTMGTARIVSTIGRGFWTDVRDVFFPVGLTSYHPPVPTVGFGITFAVVGALVLAAGIAVGWLRSTGLVAGMTGFGLAVAFGLNWFDGSRGGAVSDASGYVAAAFLIALMVAGISRLIPPAKLSSNTMLGVGIALLVIFGAIAWNRTGAFKSPVDFWTDAVNKDPYQSHSQAMLAEQLRLKALAEYEADSLDHAKYDMEQAIDHAGLVGNAEPRDYAAGQRTWANALVSEGQVKQGLEHYAVAIRLTPHDPDLRMEGARALMMLKDYRQAIEQINYALGDEPGSAEPHRELGRAYAGTGNFKRAIFEENRVLDKNPQDIDARQILAESLAGDGQFDKALAQYQELGFNFHVARPENYAEMARIFEKLDRYREAAFAWEIANKLDPDRKMYLAEYNAAYKKSLLQAATRPTTNPTTGPTTTATTMPTTAATMPVFR
jgi:tetratricopeptide (TPR) repeat protein